MQSRRKRKKWKNMETADEKFQRPPFLLYLVLSLYWLLQKFFFAFYQCVSGFFENSVFLIVAFPIFLPRESILHILRFADLDSGKLRYPVHWHTHNRKWEAIRLRYAALNTGRIDWFPLRGK